MAIDLAGKLDPRHAALIIVDVQNDFCHSEGTFGQRGFDMSAAQQAARQTQSAIDLAHQVGVPVIFIQTLHSHWTTDEAWEGRYGNLPGSEGMVNCREGTWGAEFYHVAPGPQDRVVVKHRYSAFLYTELELILRCKGVRTAVVCGVTTDNCVRATVLDAFMRGYHVVVLEDGTACTRPHLHELAIKDMSGKLAIIMPSARLTEFWGSASTR